MLYSACFLNENEKNFILTSNYNKKGKPEPIKIFDLNGEKIGEINDSNDSTLIIKIYYDEILSKNYIVTGNLNCIKSYNYNSNKLYHKYYDKGNKYMHFDIIIKDINKKIKLIECCEDGNIRIWNFHSGIILNKIKVSEILTSLSLWNDNHIFIGANGKIFLLELKNEIVIKVLLGHNHCCTIKKIIHPHYGECIISQNAKNSIIKMWINNR